MTKLEEADIRGRIGSQRNDLMLPWATSAGPPAANLGVDLHSYLTRSAEGMRKHDPIRRGAMGWECVHVRTCVFPLEFFLLRSTFSAVDIMIGIEYRHFFYPLTLKFGDTRVKVVMECKG